MFEALWPNPAKAFPAAFIARRDQVLHVKGDQAVQTPFMSSLTLWCQQAAGALRGVNAQCITFTEVVQQALQQA